MYICLCHGFTDRQVRGLADEGKGSTAGVYRALGVRPKCGKCVPMVRDILRGHGRTASACDGADD
jgi:bacterioferritin-associated ferredoxin